MKHRVTMLAMLGALALAGVACEDDTVTGTGDEDARLRVLLTDAPADYIGAASVDIGEVVLIGAGAEDDEEGDDDGRIVLSSDGTDGFVDLLELRGAATAALADAEIEPGRYSQLRLIVEEAHVELADGYEFDDGTTERELFIPSGAQTGIKLNLSAADEDADGALEILPGETVLVLDFDVNRSFVIQGNPETPAGIKGVLFTPTLRVTVNDVAGSISGTVATALEDGPVEGLTVTATPEDDEAFEEFQTREATALTDENGDYTIHFLVPGTYEVTVAAPAGYTTDPAAETVLLDESEGRDDVDFMLVEEQNT